MELLGIPAATVVQGGLGGVGLLCVLAVLTGWLIPRRTHEREMAREQQRGDDFRGAWESADKRADVMTRQLDEILTLVRQRAGRQQR